MFEYIKNLLNTKLKIISDGFYFSIGSKKFKFFFWFILVLISIISFLIMCFNFKKTTEQFCNVYAPILDIFGFYLYEFFSKPHYKKFDHIDYTAISYRLTKHYRKLPKKHEVQVERLLASFTNLALLFGNLENEFYIQDIGGVELEILNTEDSFKIQGNAKILDYEKVKNKIENWRTKYTKSFYQKTLHDYTEYNFNNKWKKIGLRLVGVSFIFWLIAGICNIYSS